MHQKYDIYFCPESGQFHLYQSKNGEFVEVENQRLKTYLDKILYNKLDGKPENLKNDVPKLCQKIKNQLKYNNAVGVAIKIHAFNQLFLISGLLISTTFPEISNYVLIKTSNIVNSSNLINATSTLKDFQYLLEQTVNDNCEFSKMEKAVINEGNERFFNDWGHLFSAEQKNYILNKAKKVKVVRTTTEELNGAAGRYTKKEIQVNEAKDLTTTSHEWAHLQVDKGRLSNGSRSLYSLLKWDGIDEGINESVNMKYYVIDPTNSSYPQQREDALLLSLIIGKEPLLKSYASLESSSVIMEATPKHMKSDMYDFIRLMSVDFDATIYNSEEAKEQIDETFYEEKDEIYNKMFKVKYGKDYKDTILYNYALKDCNFINDYVEVECFDSCKTYIYKIPIEEAIKCSSLEELEDYTLSVGINMRETSLKPYMFLCNTREIEQAQSLEQLQEFVYNKLVNQGIAEDKVSLIVYEDIDEDTVKVFANVLLDRLESLMATEYDKACILREAQDMLGDSLGHEFELIAEDRLLTNDQLGVYHLFANTDIHYTSFNGNPAMSNLVQKYYENVVTERYVIIGNKVIVEMGIDDSFNDAMYGDTRIVTYAQQVTNQSEIEKYREMFKTSENKFYTFEFSNMENFDESLLKIYVSELKTSTNFLNYSPPTINL